MMLKKLIYIILLVLVSACTPKPKDAVPAGMLPPLFPDYVGVTVPVNIAPLNFLLRGDFEAVSVTASCDGLSIEAGGRGQQVDFNLKKWKALLSRASGKSVTIEVCAREDGKWLQFEPFEIYVSPDSIDPYLTYRLIEPDYEIFSRLELRERCIEDFSERSICDYNSVGDRCMNCHTYRLNDPEESFLYVRGPGGGLFLNRNGNLNKIALKTPDMVSGSVYGQFSPNGRWIVFSSNVIIPAFHSQPSKRLEVFDTKSDVYVYDIDNNRVMSSSLLADSAYLQTFPTFSPDGRSIYFCNAEWNVNIANIDSLQYSILRIDFDEGTGQFGEKVDTVVGASVDVKSSTCHPRISPDGKYLLYTVADYGTFPIWHPEADLQMLDLLTGELIDMGIVNSDKSDTYHCWSSSGRWFVFASKRDDGLFGKPYFCHIDASGRPSKPFVLPQKSAAVYDETLKSFNVPELGTGPLRFSPSDVASALSAPETTVR